MAFRLKGRSPLGKDLRRLVGQELDTALAALGRPAIDAEAIHEARKSIKKIRAVLRLLHDPLGPLYQAENVRLREAAHRLSALRDVDATGATLRALQQRHPDLVTPDIVQGIESGLCHRAAEAKATAREAVDLARAAIAGSSRCVPDEVGAAGTRRAVRAGMTRGYRRARRAMVGIGVDADPALVHLWRRREKDHWYHVRLFEGLHAGACALARQLGRLETLLGDDHDLAVLRSLILADPRQFGDARSTTLVLGTIDVDQVSLRTQALPLGRGLFARRPRAFRGTVDRWWAGRAARARGGERVSLNRPS